jgi:hypothetical protein
MGLPIAEVPIRHKKSKILTAEAAESAAKKGLNLVSNSYIIWAISIGFALTGFPRKTSNTTEMRFFLLCVLRVLCGGKNRSR